SEFMCGYSFRPVCYQRGSRLLPSCRKAAIKNAIRGTRAFLFIRRAAALVTLSHTEDAGQRAHRQRDWWLKKHYKIFTSKSWSAATCRSFYTSPRESGDKSPHSITDAQS